MEGRPLLLLLLLGALLLSASTAATEAPEQVVGHTGLEQLLVQLLEILRTVMKEGSSAMKPLDPLHLDHTELDIATKEMTLKGSISEFDIYGLSDFELKDLTFNFENGAFLDISVSFANLSADGHYDANGNFKKGVLNIPLDGDGQLIAECKNVSFEASVRLGISPKGEIIIKDFSLPSWEVKYLQFQLGGLFHDSSLGTMINKILDDSLTHLVEAYHSKITTILNKFVKDTVGAALAELHSDSPLPPLPGAAGRSSRRSPAPSLSLQDLKDVLQHSLQDADSDQSEDLDDVIVELDDSTMVRPAEQSPKVTLVGAPRFFRHGELLG